MQLRQAGGTLVGLLLTKEKLFKIPSLFFGRATLRRRQASSDPELLVLIGCPGICFGGGQVLVVFRSMASGNPFFEKIQDFLRS